MRKLAKLFEAFRPRNTAEYAEWYLSQATDTYDLERRMKELEKQHIYQYR